MEWRSNGQERQISVQNTVLLPFERRLNGVQKAGGVSVAERLLEQRSEWRSEQGTEQRSEWHRS